MNFRDLVMLGSVLAYFLVQWPYVQALLALLNALVGALLAWQTRRGYHRLLDDEKLERHRSVALELLRNQPEGQPAAVRTLCLSVLDLTGPVTRRKAG